MSCIVKSVSRSASTVKLTVLTEGKTEQLRILAADEKAAGGFASGMEADRALLQTLSLRYEAVKRAISILSFGDNSALSLQKKLQERGVLAENAKFAVRLMCKQGYIKEAEQVRRKARRLFEEKSYGPARILAKLESEGYAQTDIENAIEEMRKDGVDFAKKSKELFAAFVAQGDVPDKAKAKVYRLGY
ncbi:MAG: RecX family transcriptional regulator [Clostridia bacterium]|nr:RecX family transcriptional regulator [Clostridia bacterium]